MAWFEINTRGRNRFVFLCGSLALKVPSLRNWRDFLFGLLNNMNEAQWSKQDGHCPVLFAMPGGFLVVMPRLRILTEEEFYDLDPAALVGRAEHKPDSWGWLDGRVVAVDYGW